jgi:ABC-type glutathione transport system ATPase component
MAAPGVLVCRDLRKGFPGGAVALDGVDLHVAPGTTVALAGASGSGKSTLARCVVRLTEPDAGTIRFAGMDLLALRGEALRRARVVGILATDEAEALTRAGFPVRIVLSEGDNLKLTHPADWARAERLIDEHFKTEQ